MHRHLCAVLLAATAVAVMALTGCSHSHPKVVSSSSSPAVPVTSASTPVVATAPTSPTPAPEALIDVLNRLADPNVPGVNKVGLVEGATADNAPTLDKFTNALRDNGYLPMTFSANDIAWSDKNPSNVMATVTVNTAQANNGNFTFPMEFTRSQGGWQLSRRTAEMLLALGKSPAARTPAPNPPPPPAPAPAQPPPS